MKHPELIENLGKIHPKKDRGGHYGRFQCPFCPRTFIARISKVVSEHTTSCGCRKRKNFIEAQERRVKGKMTTQALADFHAERSSGAKRAYLCKKHGLKLSEYSAAIKLASQQMPTRTVSPVARIAQVVDTSEAYAQPTLVPPPTQNIYNAPVTIINEATMKKDPTALQVIPFNETEQGFYAEQQFYNKFGRVAKDSQELETWYRQTKVN